MAQKLEGNSCATSIFILKELISLPCSEVEVIVAKVIMVQGTMSNAGKSLVVAGLCRIFMQDGYKVAPFKSQNMALNSFITKENLEMGRAQVVQAEAAGIEPSVRMNPILLKPTSEMGSQVIVNGVPVGNMHAMDYFKRKKEYIPVIMEAYQSLAEENDIIVIEGAGSPAEINLKQDDIVNMGLAELVDAPVLLVGDIDRGGVFAQLFGTVALLEEKEQERIKGLVINKFRGDRKILEPGLAMIEAKTGKKVVGVVPMTDVKLEEEDSLAEEIEVSKNVVAEPGKKLDIAIIRLPMMSNYTDFTPLRMEQEVSLRYVNHVNMLGNPDVIILPGSKSTMNDLRWMRDNGLEAKIKELNSTGTVVIGICGGYQMLGETITDRSGAENFGEMPGMGLLPVHTDFYQQKTMKQVTGIIPELTGIFASLTGVPYKGYEIHMGDGRTHCVVGNVFGSYVHGFFEDTTFRGKMIDILLAKAGMERREASVFDYQEYKQRQYDKLADVLRESMDMEEIYRILGL